MQVPAPLPSSQSSLVAYNLRRLMARHGLTYDDVVAATGLDPRTLRGILHAVKRPHAKTLSRLSEGLGVSADELFSGDEAVAIAEFDAATNPALREAQVERPELFERWTPRDFGELASRFGVGGPLTPDGVAAAAEQMNRDRETLVRVRLVLASDQSEALRAVIDALYDKAEVRG